MHYTFHEYLEVRVLAEWEQMIEESNDSSLNQDVSVLVRNFIQKLDGYLPQGIKTLGTNAINKVRQVLNTYKFRGLEGIDPSNPPPNLMQNSIKFLGMKIDDRNELNTLGSNITMFNKSLMRYGVKPGTRIEPRLYYQGLKHFIHNPTVAIDADLLRPDDSSDPKQVLTQVANQIKSVTPDPQVIAMVNKTLKELLTEIDYRQLATYNRGTNSGKEKTDAFLGKYGKNNTDLSQELNSDPDFKKKYNYWQGVKRRKMAQFRSERPTQGLEIAPGTEREPQQPSINPSINTSQAMG